MQVKTRTVKSPDERRSELVAAAQTLFFTKGYESTAVSDIVKAIGVAKGTFYYYFDSKLEILEAIVGEMSEQAVAVMHMTVIDESLTALEKWQRAFQTTAAWKTDRKEELLALLRVMNSHENIVMQHKLVKMQTQMALPEVAKIIEQGVAEGVFDTEFVMESAEIAFSIMQCVSDLFTELVLNPDDHPNRLTVAERKLTAIQMAVERVLGAEEGSLPLVNRDVLVAWM